MDDWFAKMMIMYDESRLINSDLGNSEEFQAAKFFYENRVVLSGVNANRFMLLGKSKTQPITFTDNITHLKKLVSSPDLPRTPIDRYNWFLNYVFKNTHFLGDPISIKSRPALYYMTNIPELSSIIEYMHKNEMIHKSDLLGNPTYCYRISLTLKGFDEVNKRRRNIPSSQAFVAMWFSEEMTEVYDDVISPAIVDAGFTPTRIDRKHFNDDIMDQIIISIRESRFVVADFTGHRGGVYFEAGFALGMGLPLICTCKADDFEKAHFDVNHRNMIVWKDEADLRRLLTDRIKATIT